MTGIPSPEGISTRRQRIAQLAREGPDRTLTSLSHNIDMDWLKEAYRLTRKDGAAGVDKQTAQEYSVNLEANLASLLERAKSGHYQAPPVRRVEIPKGGSKTETRPIGIPTFEDKVLQRAVAMVLENVYEQDFYDFSYGFRPGRSAHQALETFWNQAMDMKGGFVVEVDIQKFFDTLDKGRLQGFVRQRVSDGVIGRLIGKWLNAGVMKAGQVFYPEYGSPQGGVISPILSNVYLHEVMDKWFVEVAKPRLKGRASMVRYADDLLICCEREEDARRLMDVLPKRFERFGLKLHPEKTRLVPFRSPSPWRPVNPQPGSFDFLGFTHYWGRTLRGTYVIMRKTAQKRFSGALKRMKEWFREVLHFPIPEQHKKLCEKLRGHYGYYGITGNFRSIQRFQHETGRHWFYWLRRRGQKRKGTWEWFAGLLKRCPLPSPKIVRPITVRIAKP